MLRYFMDSFSAVIGKEGLIYVVEVPSAIVTKIRVKGNFPVRGQVDSIPFKSTCSSRKGNRYVVILNAGIRKKIRKTEGDAVEMQIEYDPEDRSLPIPEDVEMILAEDEDILNEFINLTPSYTREIVKFINEAKKEETRLKRIGLLVKRMRERLVKRRRP